MRSARNDNGVAVMAMSRSVQWRCNHGNHDNGVAVVGNDVALSTAIVSVQ